MNEVIQQKIESIEAINQRMNDSVSQTLSLIINDLAQSTNNPRLERDEDNAFKGSKSFSTIGVVSGAAFLVGSVGWIACGALWTKVLFWGGGIGLVSDFVLNKNKKSSNSSIKESSTSSLSFSAQKQSASQKIMSTIEKISALWKNLTNTNKEQLLAFIENSSLSANDKFNASSFVTVTKTLDFELLALQNQIDDAKSIEELKNNISLICKVLKDKIDKVSNLQIDSYRQVDKIMTGE